MKISYTWLQDYIDAPLPSAETIAEALTMHAFEVEGMEKNGDDTMFEIAILPNRSHDCLSYIGIAGEVATLLDLPLKLPTYAHEGDTSVNTANAVTLVPPDGKLVRRALKRLAVDVKVGESPGWLKERLIAQGQRPINNIVDATNFVMWETGQPVHAFDYDKLEGAREKGKVEIQIRNAHAGEKVITLDGKEMTLDESMLVISDAEKALDIAGVKGGNNSGIDASTKRVLLSACTFHPTSIRKTSRKLNLLTDASKRFEQDLSPVLAERGMTRLASLIADIAGAKVAADTVEFYPRKRNPYYVGVSVSETNELLGTALSTSDVEAIFNRLGFEWKKVYPIDEVIRLAPTFIDVPYKYGTSISYDTPRTFDCSAFVGYLYALSGIALPRTARDQFAFAEEVSESDARPGDMVFSNTGSDGKVEHIESLGIDQVRHTKQTFDFMPGIELPESVDHAGIYLGDGKVIHASPMSDKGKVVVEELKDAPKFQKVVGFRRIPYADIERYVVIPPPERLDLHAGPGFMISGNAADLIEEIGRVYGYGNIAPEAPTEMPAPAVNKTFYYTHKIRDILVAEGFSEVMTYAFQSEGEVAAANPLAEDKKYLRASLAIGLAQSLAFNIRNKALLGGGSVQIFEIGTIFEKGREYLQLGVVAEEQKDVDAVFEKLGTALQTTLAPKDGLIDLTVVIEQLPQPGSLADLSTIASEVSFKALSVYPVMLRDIAVWVPDAAGDGSAIIDEVKKEAGDLFVRADLFDTFSKDGKTSYAYHIVFQSQEKTLSDDEVNAIMTRITDTLNSKEGFRVR